MRYGKECLHLWVFHLQNNLKQVDLFDDSSVAESFRVQVDNYQKGIEAAYEEFELHDAVKLIIELVSLGNQHIHENEPWKQSDADARITLGNVSYLIRIATELYEPIIPDGAKRAIDAMRKGERVILFPRI